uniref:DUF5641 domain-containing protein n=1 Tax=Bursaphelenchus xylophilus TaxID=6326 RepID=A0A1I7SJB6_BURXY
MSHDQHPSPEIFKDLTEASKCNIKKILLIKEVSNRILSMMINFDWTMHTDGINSNSSKQILITSVAQEQVEDGSVLTILAVPALCPPGNHLKFYFLIINVVFILYLP